MRHPRPFLREMTGRPRSRRPRTDRAARSLPEGTACRRLGEGLCAWRRYAGCSWCSVSVLANLRHLPRIHAATIDLDTREGRLDFAEVRCRKLDVKCANVLAEVIHVGRTGDWNDPGLLGHQPGQRDLSGCRAFL